MEIVIAGIKYTFNSYKTHKIEVNESTTDNHLQQQFDEGNKREVIVANLTYIRFNCRWNH